MDSDTPAPTAAADAALPGLTPTPAVDAPAGMSAEAADLVVTSGAPQVAEASTLGQLTDLLAIGGPVVWILLVMSSIALAIVLMKLWQFRVAAVNRNVNSDQALELWRRGQPQQAIDLLAGDERPLPSLLHFGMVGVRAGNALELLREELSRLALNHLEQLRSHLRALEVIAALSPLLGLFGTVLGMIEAFRQMQLAGSQVDPSVLSGGIWVALLTTAVGLAVAIPTVMAHAWLERKTDCARHRIEDSLTQLFTNHVAASEQTARLVPISKRHAPA